MANDNEVCEFTLPGMVVDPETGCSIFQLCPCDGPSGMSRPWRNHGQYVKCVRRSARTFEREGLITKNERKAIQRAARRSECGRRHHHCDHSDSDSHHDDDSDSDSDVYTGPCRTKLQGVQLEYRGPDRSGPVTVELQADRFRHDRVEYSFPNGLTYGTVLSLSSENGLSIDAMEHGRNDLGKKMRIYVDGMMQELHTSCSERIHRGEGMPLEDPRGALSYDWFVVEFIEK